MSAPSSLRATTTRRGLRRPIGVAVAALAAVAVLALGACSAEEDESIHLVNQARAFVGAQQLPTNIDLYFKAQSWSQRMSGEQRLYHSYLPDGVGYCWRRLGENVGYGYSIRQVHDAFMNSPGHRANILDRGFNRVGIGVTRDGAGRYWVVQEFMQER